MQARPDFRPRTFARRGATSGNLARRPIRRTLSRRRRVACRLRGAGVAGVVEVEDVAELVRDRIRVVSGVVGELMIAPERRPLRLVARVAGGRCAPENDLAIAQDLG